MWDIPTLMTSLFYLVINAKRKILLFHPLLLSSYSKRTLKVTFCQHRLCIMRHCFFSALNSQNNSSPLACFTCFKCFTEWISAVCVRLANTACKVTHLSPAQQDAKVTAPWMQLPELSSDCLRSLWELLGKDVPERAWAMRGYRKSND